MPTTSPNRFRIARDYNRGLPVPIRAAHIAFAAIAPELAATRRWAADPLRRWWTRPALWAILAFSVLYPFDGPITSLVRRVPLGGDIAQELRAWQQYGAVGSLIFTALLIRLLDPARTRRILDLAAAAASAAILCQLLKIAIGRPRPRIAPFDPHVILGPFGAYPLGPKIGVRHAWELWHHISSGLWSMPSSHTAAAAALSVFLIALYPRLRPLAVGMVCLVGAARVLFNDHWPSDVAVGAALGTIAARAALRAQWGPRVFASLQALGRSAIAPASHYPERGAVANPSTGPSLPAASQDSAATPLTAAPNAAQLSPSPASPNPLHSAP